MQEKEPIQSPHPNPLLEGEGERLAWLIAIVAAAFVYHPITRNYFYGDDFLNLYRIENAGVLEYLLTPHGGHALVVRNALFYLCARAFGTEPAPYFSVVLVTHLLNVSLLFLVIRRLTDSARLACFGTVLWGTSPIHEGALGWYSVYGHVVTATALLLALALITRRAATPSRGVLRTCYGLALLAVMSFGVGIGLAMALPFAVAWLAPALPGQAKRRMPLMSLFVVAPLLYLGLFWLNGLWFSEGLETPGILTKVALQLWASIPSNLLHLIAYGLVRLVLGFAFDPALYADWMSYAVIGGLTFWGLIVAWRSPGQIRRALAACTALALGCYGMIILGRVAFFNAYSTSVMAIQPRYHYAGLIPLTIVLCLLLNHFGTARPLGPMVKTVLLLAWLGLNAVVYNRLGFPIDHHREAKEQTRDVLATIQSRIDAQSPGEDVYIPNRSFIAFRGLAPPTHFPGWAAVFVIFYPDNTVDGRRVYFADKNLDVIDASAKGKRTAGLLVPPR